MRKSSKTIIRIIIILALILIIFLLFLNDTGEIKPQKICCNDICLNIEIADDNTSRQLGLMYRESLGLDEGMLFVFDTVGTHSFWMKNTLIPLAGIRLDSHLNIVDIVEMDPCRTEKCPSYKPHFEAKYVLEINQGLISEKGLLHVGDSCKLIHSVQL